MLVGCDLQSCNGGLVQTMFVACGGFKSFILEVVIGSHPTYSKFLQYV